MSNAECNTIEEYIALCPIERQDMLKQVEAAIRKGAPNAIGKISWKMPTYWQGENLIHFALAKKHIGIYPAPSAVVAFAEQLKDYKTSKGAIQFPFSKPIPYELITEIARFRAMEAEAKASK